MPPRSDRLDNELNRAVRRFPPRRLGGIRATHGHYTVRTQMLVADPDDRCNRSRSSTAETSTAGWAPTRSAATLRRIALRIPGGAADRGHGLDPVDPDRRQLGIISGYSGGQTDSVIQRIADIISNVPLLPLLIFLVFIIGPNLWLIILVLVAFSWTGSDDSGALDGAADAVRPARRSGAGDGRVATRGSWSGSLPAGGAVHRRPDDLLRPGGDPGRSLAELPRVSAIRRSRPGARCWKPASGPARSTSATGGG